MHTLVAVLILVMSVTLAHAQSATAPTWSVGDTWKRSNGTVVIVVKADESGYALKGNRGDCPACLTHLDKNLTPMSITDADGKPIDATQLAGVSVGPNWRFLEWPLEVKKTWTLSGARIWKGTPQTVTTDVAVKSFEDVKTKAGTFKAYRMEYSFTARSAGVDRSGSWSITSWYSPDVKNVVKQTSNSPGFRDWELESYSLK